MTEDPRRWVERAELAVASGRIDFARSRFVRSDGSIVTLTTREVELLDCLAASEGAVVSRERLLTEVWGHHHLSLSRAVDTTIARLRKKLEPDAGQPAALFTEHGAGYRLLPARDLAPAVHDVAPPRRLLHLGPRTADLAAGWVEGPEGRVALTTRERLVLEQLARSPGVTLDGDALARRAGVSGGRAALANAIHRLRHKLGDDADEARYLVTVRGTGYRLDARLESTAALPDEQVRALRSLTDHIGLVLGLDDCVVYRADATGALSQVAAFGPKRAADGTVVRPLTQRPGEGLVGVAAATGRLVCVPDTSLDTRYLLDLHPAASELAVPVSRGGRVIGVLDSESAARGAYGDVLVAAFQSLAVIAASAFA